ncbi:hypothetical protein NOCA2270146 [metagenome]|uniref:Uncharacterized protein n=1 Tax=metagenome TaxID=256318 RepID=A0A2P2C0I9_9ZZZZ
MDPISTFCLSLDAIPSLSAFI